MPQLKSLGAFFFLLIICVLAYWDIATLQDTLKWDMLDCYYPWRYFVGESVKHQVFPLWNPYQHLGYPIYADMRSVFYPEGFIVGLFGGYNLKILNFLFIFYITIAALGMYRLIGLFVKNEYAKLTAASAYLLCGFFVGHGQEMFGIIAATWIPWVLHYFIRFQKKFSWSDLWKLAFFLFLQLTGGYQALSLILFYLLLTIAIAELIKGYQENGWEFISRMVKMNIILGVVVFLSLSVLIVTYLQVSPNVERLTGLSLKDSYIGLLTPQALLSLIAPYSVAGDANFLGTNITMANVYVGVIILAFYLLGFFQKKNTQTTIIWFFGILCLLASLGPYTPVREFLYNYVPGMNLFRMSSFFSYFSQLSFILIAAIALEQFLNNPSSYFKKLAIALGVVLIALVTISLTSFFDKPDVANMFRLGQIPPSYTYHMRLFLHSILQIGFVLIFLALMFGLRNRKTTLSLAVLAFVIIEMSAAVSLNFSTTIGGGYNPAELQAKLDLQPSGFPIPDQSTPIVSNTESKPNLGPLWHNTNIYTKTVSWDGFNSFRLDRFENYKIQQTEAYEQGLEQPLLYSPSGDAKIEVQGFDPNTVVCTIATARKCTLILQQTYYPGWEVMLNGKVQELVLHNDIFPAVIVPKGQNTVVFKYKNKPVLMGFGVSYIVFALIILSVTFHLLRSNNLTSKKAAIVSSILMVIMLLVLGLKWSSLKPMDEKRVGSYAHLREMLSQHLTDDVSLYLNVDNLRLMNDSLSRSWKGSAGCARNLIDSKLSAFENLIDKDTAKTAIYAGSNLAEDRVVIEVIQQRFPTKWTSRIGREFVHVFTKEGERHPIYTSKTDLELASKEWNYKEHQRDSSAQSYSGSFGWSISGSQMGSPGLGIRIGDITELKRLKFVFQAKCLVPSKKCNDANVYVQIEREGRPTWFQAKNINSSAINTEDWFSLTHLVEPDFDLRPDDILKVFVWGGEGEAFYLDDLSFAIYPQE